ncbi:MAG TPA: UDP-N-acetylmuramoyl-L-alanine--D-glutamate ligase [Spirochaetota bacterium]|nr:UDP-N-acetylmuramoyl-L-alanine--D-glutamate ligase [Spirochaetota bacterium]HRZ27205.1 UDP-N-acetylmuramoyl-L-alanine--D-glutamate ligase [Spirochaetota bacterium]
MNHQQDIKGLRNVLVVGLGYRTGLAASNFLASRGIAVTVSDSKSASGLADVIARLDPSVRVIAGEQKPEILDGGFDLVILSPGVPKSIPLVAEAAKRAVPVVSEIEFASWFVKGDTVGITGTDGKSTTTALIDHVFSALGFDSRMGGNIGIPLISIADKTGPESITVIELSSFQLETITRYRPGAAVVLNVTPDHLDRYDGMDDYTAAKFRITMNQRPEDFLVYNADDPVVSLESAKSAAAKKPFSLTDEAAGAYCRGGFIYLNDGKARLPIIDTSKMKIMGLHNVQNAMACLLVVDSLIKRRGLSPDYARIAAAVYSFPGLPHRMERIGTLAGRTFINDSKATTVGAVDMAVRSLQGGAVLILGGRTKGDDYSRLRKIVEGKVRGVVLIGESAESFSKIFEGFNYELADSLDEAAASAMKMSREGDAIVLSPACASFDWFRNYEERGDCFRKSYEKLLKGEIAWT